jgi:hypothetical protein
MLPSSRRYILTTVALGKFCSNSALRQAIVFGCRLWQTMMTAIFELNALGKADKFIT